MMNWLWLLTGYLPSLRLLRKQRALDANLAAMSRLSSEALTLLELQGEDGLHRVRSLLYSMAYLRT